MDQVHVIDDLITLQINSGLVTNFIGSLVAARPATHAVSMVSHFLESMMTGTHISIVGFQILSISGGEDGFEMVVRVLNRPLGLWHTHIIRCTKVLSAGPGEYITFLPDKGDD